MATDFLLDLISFHSEFLCKKEKDKSCQSAGNTIPGINNVEAIQNRNKKFINKIGDDNYKPKQDNAFQIHPHHQPNVSGRSINKITDAEVGYVVIKIRKGIQYPFRPQCFRFAAHKQQHENNQQHQEAYRSK